MSKRYIYSLKLI